MLFLALDLQRELVALRIGCFAVGRIEMWLNGLQISVRQVRRLVKQSTEHQKSEACPKMAISDVSELRPTRMTFYRCLRWRICN